MQGEGTIMVDRPGTHPAWTGRKVTVAGLARSGRAVALLLGRHGARVTATDLRSAGDLGIDVSRFAEAGVELILEGHRFEVLDETEVLVVSPGIPKSAPFLQEARRRGIRPVSELEVASTFARAPMAALTGTNGKSTTVTVLGQLVEALGLPVSVAGNVGTALSEVVESVPESGALVVEVSSYQLEDVDTFHPRAAGILNVTPDHLDRYDSFEHYRDTKLRIFARQTAGDIAVLPGADPVLDGVGHPGAGRLLRFGAAARVTEGAVLDRGRLMWREAGRESEVLSLPDLPLKGPHNHLNVAAALCLLRGLGLDPTDDRVRERLTRVHGLPHRLEPSGTVRGVEFFNDSKATNPDSLEVALQSFATPVVLIAGGKAKESDYRRLAALVRDRVAEVVFIGEGAEILAEAWAGAGRPMHHAGSDFAAAVALAYSRARMLGTSVLLSPGCASFDMFTDYEDRGNRFKALVTRLGEGS